MKKVLIVIDVQNDFIDGSLGTKEAKAIVSKVKDKINDYIDKGYTVFFTRDTHFKDYLSTKEGENLPVEHCIKNTNGWQIGIEVTPGTYNILDKNTFGYPEWDKVIPYKSDGKLIIELCGLCTDICVITNTLIIRTVRPEAEIIVDANCCAGSTPDRHKAALEVMRSCQITVKE